MGSLASAVALEDLWPLAGLVVRTPRLELRWPRDDDLIALASLAVTRRVGYRNNGDRILAVEGRRRRMLAFTLERSGWSALAPDDVEVDGLGPCLELFGAPPAAEVVGVPESG